MRTAQAIEGDLSPASHRLTIDGDVPSTSENFEAVQFCSSRRPRSCSGAGMRCFAMNQALPEGKNLSTGNRLEVVHRPVAAWQHVGMSEIPFGEVLSRYLHAKHMRASDLARRMGVSDAAVSRWRAGRVPDTLLLVTLAEVLGITPKELLGADFVPPQPAEAPPRQGRPPRAEPDVVGFMDAVTGGPQPEAAVAVVVAAKRPKPGRAKQR